MLTPDYLTTSHEQITNPQSLSLTLSLKTFHWKLSGSSGVLNTSLVYCNKCCLFLPYSQVSIDWLYCARASGPKFGSVTPPSLHQQILTQVWPNASGWWSQSDVPGWPKLWIFAFLCFYVKDVSISKIPKGKWPQAGRKIKSLVTEKQMTTTCGACPPGFSASACTLIPFLDF